MDGEVLLKLYNTLTQQVEPLNLRDGKARVYACGITPYDTTHLGHAFTYTSIDILIRYLEYRDIRVKYVQNVTDVDDDILRKARASGEDWIELGNRWTAHFIHDMEALNVRPPDVYPRATEVIEDILKAVKQLEKAGLTYEANGNVYYSIDAWPPFGKLSRMTRSAMLPVANERGNFPDDPNKRDPLDFVLWQAYRPGEPAWDSPWGKGRPGWHIECSTMAQKYLGDIVDIHGGGADLCFPHHECEIAQVEPVDQKEPFARYWFHVAMVRHEGEKMSKSLGNLVMIRDLLRQYSPDAIRLYLGGHHYRETWQYDEGELNKAQLLADEILEARTGAGGQDPAINPAPYVASFTAALDNDLDTKNAVGVLGRLAKDINQGILSGRDVRDAQESLGEIGGIFGLQMEAQRAETKVIDGWQKHLLKFQAV